MRKRTENIRTDGDAWSGEIATRAPPSRELRNACTHHGGRFVCMHVWCAHSATSLPNQALSLPVSRSASRCVCHQHRASHAIHAVLLLLVDENTRAGCRAREASANHSPPNNHGAAGSACSGCQLATARTSTALAPSLPHLKLRAPPSSWASQLAAPPVREPPISGCAAVVPAPSSDHGAYTTSAPSQSRPQYAPLSTRDGCAS